MKRKDLVVGETYYVNHKRGMKEAIFTYRSATFVPECGSKVIALEPYEEKFTYAGFGKTKGQEFVKVSKGNGVLVEQTYLAYGEKKTRTTIVNLSTIICPLEEAVKQIQANLELARKRDKERAELQARRAEYEKHFFEPAMKDLTTALTKLHVRLEHAPKHFYRDTQLSEMPLDVIETLTAIINEALVEKVGA